MEYHTIIQAALKSGAAKAAVIQNRQIVLSAAFRDICAQNGCGLYGRCWACPPDIGEIEPLMERVRSYPKGLLYQTIAQIEDSFDIEGMARAGKEHAQVSQRVQKSVGDLLGPDILHLSCGGCRLCDKCAKFENLPCRHPDKALPPMEGYGINVYNTTRETDLKYTNGQNTVTFFGIVLFGKEPHG